MHYLLHVQRLYVVADNQRIYEMMIYSFLKLERARIRYFSIECSGINRFIGIKWAATVKRGDPIEFRLYTITTLPATGTMYQDNMAV